MPQWIKLHNKNTLYCGKYLDYEKINLNINELDMDVEDKVKVRSTWTYDDERKLLEELLTSRFNFMVLFATLFMSVIVQSNSPIIRLFLSTFGTLISVLIFITMVKTGDKLQDMLNLFRFQKPEDHVLAMQSAWISGNGRFINAVSKYPSIFSSVLIISKYIPFVILTMFILTLFACIFKYWGFINSILGRLLGV